MPSIWETIGSTLIKGAVLPPPPEAPDIGGLTGVTPQDPRRPVVLMPGGERIVGQDMRGEIGPHALGDKYGAGTVVGYASFDENTGRWVDPQTLPGGDDQFEVPTLGELDRLGREAVQGQYDAEVETFESGTGIRDQELADVQTARDEKAAGVLGVQEDRTQQITDFEDGLLEMSELPDDVRKEAYGNVESLKMYIDGRISGALAGLRSEYAGMRDIIESMNAEHFAEARDLTAEMLQATGSGVMAQIGNTVTAMQADPRFQEMSADQQGVALSTIRMQGAQKIGAELVTVGAQERARLDEERLARDTLLTNFDTAYLQERGATTRELEGVGLAQVGMAQREAGKAVTDAQVASVELMANVRRDMADFRIKSRLAEQQIIASQNMFILQGNRDAFTMNKELQRPVLAAGMAMHVAAMIETSVGLLQLQYNNDVNQYALQTGYIGSLMQDWETFQAYQMQKDIQTSAAEAAAPPAWSYAVPNLNLGFTGQLGGGGDGPSPGGGGGGGGD